MSNRSIGLSDALYDYLLAVSLREPEILAELRRETMAMAQRSMQIAPEQGQFMALLVLDRRPAGPRDRHVYRLQRLGDGAGPAAGGADHRL